MKSFMNENFLLSNETAVELYHDYAKDMPIMDYHCHLNPKEIYDNKQFKNITEIWLYGDHYKWRAMRSNGVDEKFITGEGSDYEKFLALAKTVPMLLGNPLYHWVHLELQRFFDINEVLNEKTAPEIWEKVNKMLTGDGFRVKDLINKANVKEICTTDDPIDSLEYHQKIKEDKKFEVKVLPTFRPDKGVEISRGFFLPWLEKLVEVNGKAINNYKEFLEALEARVNYFHENGCRLSDHALDSVPYEEATLEEVEVIFAKAIKKETLSLVETEKYRTFTLRFLSGLYSKLQWTMQLHMNAMRNNNTAMFNKLGADVGFDSINDSSIAYPLSRLLDAIETESTLPKTILYSLNALDNDVIGTMLGNFQGSGVPGKIQFGSAWWFNDNKEGMITQMKSLANLGLLSRFVGMLTDSRSFLSYTRHEYFRRILCNLIGEWVENGEFPYDIELLGSMVRGICYNNAKEYFKI
ncbi:MAG: glucuronate isomerase [Clostridiaceae bacterium]|nr:glucuronate isomerase [Clostridiaceae bacterium]